MDELFGVQRFENLHNGTSTRYAKEVLRVRGSSPLGHETSKVGI